MFIRTTLLSTALAAGLAVPAFGGVNAFGGQYGEATYQVQQPTDGQKTRAEVQAEVLRARQNRTLTYVGDYPAKATQRAAGTPTSQMGAAGESGVSADGYRLVGGEIGYIYVGPRSN